MKTSLLTVLGLAVLLLCSLSFADAAGAAAAKMKMSALGNATAAYVAAGQMATFDNFILNGTEYVVASIDMQPSYLLSLERKKAADNSTDTTLYEAKIIRDAALIENIYRARMSSYSKPSDMLTALNDMAPLAAKFDSSRALGEKRCNVLLGIDRNKCKTPLACAYYCNATTLCSEFLAKNPNLGDDILAYANGTANMDALSSEIGALNAKLLSDGASLPLLDSYASSVGRLKNASAKAAAASVISGNSVCTGISYDLQSVADAAQKVQAMQSATAAFKNQEAGLSQILNATAKLPPVVLESAPVEMMNESRNATEEAKDRNAENRTAARTDAGNVPQENAAVPKIAVIEQPKTAPAAQIEPKGQDALGAISKVIVALAIAAGVAYLVLQANRRKGLG